jgi:hypothetical protein
MKLLLAAILAALASGARAQTAIVGDAWILGQVMVGTTTPSGARLNVAASSATEIPFQVSGVDLTPFLRVSKDGTVGMSTTSAAELDVNGSGDSDNTALMIQSGNFYGAGTSRLQITFGQNGATDRRHAISSTHSSTTANGSIDFLIWTPAAGSASTLPTMTVLSLQSTSTTSGMSAHVMPVSVSTVEFTVSDGSSLGGGTIHAAAQASASSREWKKDISYLGDAEEARAYERVSGLKHVSFRYARLKKGGRYERNSRAPMHRGLIYEDAPAEIRGPGETLSFDERLLDSEMAFKELARRLDGLRKEVGP